MKKIIFISGLILLTGCTNPMNQSDQSMTSLNNTNVVKVSNGNNPHDIYTNRASTQSTNFGYVRHQKKSMENDLNTNENLPTINRKNVAELVSKIATKLPHINDVATLVSDEAILVAYSTDATNRKLASDQVKKTAISVVPSYYHVYVSDNPQMFEKIHRFSERYVTDKGIDRILETTIAEMKKSPQGFE